MTTIATAQGVQVQDGFADFYTGTFGDLAGYGWHLTGDPHLGDELAQEALTRVCARWGLLRDPRPYAFRVVTNLARDRWRSEARERAALPDLVPPESQPAHDTATLDAVRRLPAHLRDVVLLHYFADLPVEAVATALRRPTGTVKRRLSDARAQLALTLQDLP